MKKQNKVWRWMRGQKTLDIQKAHTWEGEPVEVLPPDILMVVHGFRQPVNGKSFTISCKFCRERAPDLVGPNGLVGWAYTRQQAESRAGAHVREHHSNASYAIEEG